MTIARWAGNGQPTAAELKQIAVKLTEKAIEGLGGMKRFVSRGAVVWVKPNIGWDRKPEQAANTNPDVVATLVRLVLRGRRQDGQGGRQPCNLAQATYQKSGIAAAAKAPAPKCSSSITAASARRPSRASGSRASPSIPTSSIATW